MTPKETTLALESRASALTADPIAAEYMATARRIVDETEVDGTPYPGLQDAVAIAITEALVVERERWFTTLHADTATYLDDMENPRDRETVIRLVHWVLDKMKPGWRK